MTIRDGHIQALRTGVFSRLSKPYSVMTDYLIQVCPDNYKMPEQRMLVNICVVEDQRDGLWM